MTLDQVVELSRGAIMLSLVVGAPILIVAVVVSLVVNVLQAVTQLQDQTLAFVPKIIVMMLTMLLTLPWIITSLTDYSITLFRAIPSAL
ncbi:MAG: flagellar biosynthesis protein FliQ [Planctomycetaceae bacterium]|nr:flagellar biosynthesis protein FliQ [Planctomycetaceae bacterium]